MIDFGFSFFSDKTRLQCDEEYSGNKRFWSVLSFHSFSEFFKIYIFIYIYKHALNIAQSQRDDLESLGYLLSALFQGSLPWDKKRRDTHTWCIKMSTPGSVLFRKMDPSFLEYWKDVRSLAFNEVPDYCTLRSRFVQCWERKGFDGLPGEYDWVAFLIKLYDRDKEKTPPVVLLDNAPPPAPPPPEIPSSSVSVVNAPSVPVMAPVCGNLSSHSAH